MLKYENMTRQRIIIDWAWCTIVAVILVSLASTSSPLYAFNDWVDANAFLTMGKGILDGMVPYRDLFEQKGPLLYFLYSLANLIQRDGFLGVFILEAVSLTIALHLAGRIVEMFLPARWRMLLCPLFAMLILSSASFEAGGSAEAFCLPLIMGLLVILIGHMQQNHAKPMPSQSLFLAGLLGGLVFLIKYNLLGYWLGFALIMLIEHIRYRRPILEARKFLWAIAGFVIALLPTLIYFALNRALADFFDVYILINTRQYIPDMSPGQRVLILILAIGNGFGNNPAPGLLILFGLWRFGRARYLRPPALGSLALPLMGLIQIIAIYAVGRSHVYYFFALMPLTLFGLIALALLAEKCLSIRKFLISRPPVQTLLVVGLISAALTLLLSPNSGLIGKSRQDYPQYVFAGIIRQVSGATLLNYGFLDGGFYTAAGITPRFKYFMLNNIGYAQLPEMYREQARYIAERQAHFVVLRLDPEENAGEISVPGLLENYVLVSEMTAVYRNDYRLVYNYALYQLRQIQD